MTYPEWHSTWPGHAYRVPLGRCILANPIVCAQSLWLLSETKGLLIEFTSLFAVMCYIWHLLYSRIPLVPTQIIHPLSNSPIPRNSSSQRELPFDTIGGCMTFNSLKRRYNMRSKNSDYLLHLHESVNISIPVSLIEMTEPPKESVRYSILYCRAVHWIKRTYHDCTMQQRIHSKWCKIIRNLQWEYIQRLNTNRNPSPSSITTGEHNAHVIETHEPPLKSPVQKCHPMHVQPSNPGISLWIHARFQQNTNRKQSVISTRTSRFRQGHLNPSISNAKCKIKNCLHINDNKSFDELCVWTGVQNVF